MLGELEVMDCGVVDAEVVVETEVEVGKNGEAGDWNRTVSFGLSC